ncbi:class I SAM-dependent methyltransferase [Nocardia sp. NPDC051756]|uniref:class I SAM-dependent methyltransferase n=1 Tax=Nocardia sp. NPDC051756 TaxID=3154751 RepID=UPI00343ED897
MPTIPSGQPPLPRQESHQAREIAESFGVDAERYDRSRPRYPEEMVQAILAAGPGRDVLDVGIGTGIVARQFQAAGCHVFGVEPDERMAEFARRGGTEVEVSTFETWDPAGRTFDIVVAGQAWHWVDTVVGAAKAAEVLRPGGLLAPFWNVSQPPPELERAFADVFRKVVPDSPVGQIPTGSASQLYAAMCDKTSDGIRQSGAFTEPQQQQFHWQQQYTRDEYLEYSATTGATTRLPPPILDRVLAGLGTAIDAAGGTFTVHYTAAMVTAVRTID